MQQDIQLEILNKAINENYNKLQKNFNKLKRIRNTLNTDLEFKKIDSYDIDGSDSRYRKEVLNNNFSFLNSYFQKLNKAFFSLIDYSEIDNAELGYQFPSIKEVDLYVNQRIEKNDNYNAYKNRIINQNYTTIKDALTNILQGEQSNVFILGKVGSGKSTFLQLLNKTTESLDNFNILYIDFSYQQNTKLFNYIRDIDTKKENRTTIAKDIIYMIQKLFIYNIFTKETFFNKIEENDKFIAVMKVSNMYNSRKELYTLFELKTAIEMDLLINLNNIKIQNLFNYLYKELSQDEKFKIIFSIDGFDILDPAIEEQFKLFINILTNDVQDKLIPDTLLVTPKNISYVSTFRSCTAKACDIINSQNINNQRVYELCPIPAERLIERAIKYVIHSTDFKFYSKYEQFFLKIFELAIDAIKEYVILEEFKNDIIQQFDYDYRFLFEYLSHIQYYIIFKGLFNIGEIRPEPEELIKLLENNIPDFLKRKKYIIRDILLLKDKTEYTNPYKIKDLKLTLVQSLTREFANHNLQLLNNIYNYLHLASDKQGVFPLLIKYRILQIANQYHYKLTINDIQTKLNNIGYTFTNNEVELILKELIISKFIKIRKINGLIKYAITNKGKLVLDLSLKSAYYQHIITFSLIPDTQIFNSHIEPYTPNKTKPQKALIVGIKDSFVFLLLIKMIENTEKYNDYVVFDTILSNTTNELKYIMKGFKSAYNHDSKFINKLNSDVKSIITFMNNIYKKLKED